MPPFQESANSSTMQRVLPTSSSSSSHTDESEEGSSYMDSLEEGKAPLLDEDEDLDVNYGDDELEIKTGKSKYYSSPARQPKFPKERYKAGLAVFLLFIAALCNDLVLSIVHERVPSGPPLPDIVFDNTPYVPYALVISEYLMLSLFAAMLIITFLHRHRWIVLRRIATIGSLLYFGRCLTMFVTQVPKADANYYCSPKLQNDSHLMWSITMRALSIASGVGLTINGKHKLCGDYIYSGHTIVLVITYLFIREYSPKNWRPLHLISAVFSFTGVFLLLVSRGHYTIDVLVAYWITTRVFWQYHTIAAMPSLRHNRSGHNHLSKIFWYPLFSFMEANVLRPVPQRYGFPFTITSCKKWFTRHSKLLNLRTQR
uniref:Sphingomyelin synthase-like domain-containing protein n=2 Tax=Acrobeloides nanus TaxID=290746 RepID=A0A914DWU6_9BILA